MAEYEGWKLRENGDVEFNPYVGCQTATLPADQFAVQIRYITGPDEHPSNPQYLQLVFSRSGLLEFQTELQALAKRPHRPRVH